MFTNILKFHVCAIVVLEFCIERALGGNPIGIRRKLHSYSPLLNTETSSQ